MTSGHHAATLSKGKIGILHGMKSYFLQDKDGQIKDIKVKIGDTVSRNDVVAVIE